MPNNKDPTQTKINKIKSLKKKERKGSTFVPSSLIVSFLFLRCFAGDPKSQGAFFL